MNTHNSRHLHRILSARDSQDGAGVKLKRVFSYKANGHSADLDPFLLLDEFSSNSPNDYIGGFPDHPHRGFETVTYMLAGRMEHRDHLGNQGQLKAGSVQWMTAASGVIHSEMPQQEAGLLQGFQLWVNLPAADKMKAPDYQEFEPEDIPVYTLASGATLKAIAGSAQVENIDVQGAVSRIVTAPLYFDITLPPEQEVSVPVPAGHTVLTYVFEGKLNTDRGAIGKGQLGQWVNGEQLRLRASEAGTRLLLLAAAPIHESVVQYGPFVMNTQEEIEQALRDYRDGRLVQSVKDAEKTGGA